MFKSLAKLMLNPGSRRKGGKFCESENSIGCCFAALAAMTP